MKFIPDTIKLSVAGALAFAFCVPAARAMVSSVYEKKNFWTEATVTEIHNTNFTTAATDISEIWNRTIRTGNGTAVYLGKNEAGQHLILTAEHVSTNNLSIAADDGSTYTLSATGTEWRLTNSDGSGADLQIVAVNTNDVSSEHFLNSLDNISVCESYISLEQNLYAVGTGKSTSVGSSYQTGTREKQWAIFSRDRYEVNNSGETAYYDLVENTDENYGTTTCFVEKFSDKNTSFQATEQDSGSGVFVYDSSAGEWLLTGTILYVGGTTSDAKNIGYAENNSAENPVVFYTFFADLSQYADQINAIMAIPEPSTFGLLAGTLAIGIAAIRRSRRRCRK